MFEWDLNGEDYLDSYEDAINYEDEGNIYDDDLTSWHENIKNLQKNRAAKCKAQIPTKTNNCYWIYAENKESNFPLPTNNSGKWLIFEKPEFIDSAWAQIKDATERGILGGSSKVSTKMASDGKGDYVICIYTYDWTDEKDVMKIRHELYNLGFEKPIPYKTDQDTRDQKYAHKGNKNISKYYC